MKLPLHNETLPIVTDEDEHDVTSVYFCDICNGCLEKRHTYRPILSLSRKCRRHGTIVRDVTRSPLGRVYRERIRPDLRFK